MALYAIHEEVRIGIVFAAFLKVSMPPLKPPISAGDRQYSTKRYVETNGVVPPFFVWLKNSREPFNRLG